jgi:xanthine dehydrogenase accessory factor
MKEGRPAALVTITGIAGSTPRRTSSRMLVYADGEIIGSVGGGAFEYKVIALALTAISTGRPNRFSAHLTRDLGMCCGGAMEAYIEPLETQVDLIIYGAGHVGTATATMAHAAGFRVTIIDERDEFANQERFDEAITVRCADPMSLLDELPWGMDAYHLVVTHSHQVDQDLVARILPMPLAWLGMIGSRSKVAKFFIRFRAAGLDEALFSKLSAPVGLDIGAETPNEIAVSIVAELVRVRRGAQGPCQPLADLALDARGGDGAAHPPALSITQT